jgi:cytoskeleton protein RodZ
LILDGNDLAHSRCMEVGHQLSTARQRRGLTLDDISRTTKIPVSLLEAIERDDVARLPQGFFTRAFVRAYAHEVGVNADDLLDRAQLGEVEEVADAPVVHVPIEEPSSSKSLFVGLALGVACTMFYSSYASPAQPAVPSPAAVTSVTARVEPAAFAPPPCAPAAPVEAPVPIRRPAPVQSIPVTHIVPATQVEPSSAIADSAPVMSDAILPTPDPAPAPSPVEQF